MEGRPRASPWERRWKWVADAAVALLAQDGDTVLTSDPGDTKRLLEAIGTRARIRTV